MEPFEWVALIMGSLVLLGILSLAGFLAIGALALRKRNYVRADTMSTLAGVGSWILMALEGLLAIPFLLQGGSPFALPPATAAVLSYPPLVWYFARTLHRSTARRRGENLAASRADREAARAQAAARQARERESESAAE